MGLFGPDEKLNLEQILGNQAQQKVTGIEDQYGQAKKRLVSQQAHMGRLGSGVSNYNFGDLAAAEGSDIGDVYSSLAGSLGAIPAEGQLNQGGYNRNFELAQLIGRLNKPSSLQEALGALGTAGNIAGTFAAFA